MKNLSKCQEAMTLFRLLDYLYHQKHCKINGIELVRQTNTSISRLINFIGKLQEDNGTTMFFIAEK